MGGSVVAWMDRWVAPGLVLKDHLLETCSNQDEPTVADLKDEDGEFA